MGEPKSVAELLSYRVLRLSNTLALHSSRYYREQFGLTLPEWRTMSVIASRRSTTARDISRVLATDKGWVGISVESLWRRGYLTRSTDKQDRRRTLLGLTTKGKEMHAAILSAAQRRQRRLLAALPVDDAERLIASLDRLQTEADQMLKELSMPNERGAPKSRD
jgi:DNA-binding MarR family transcriptional regulator